MRIYICGSISDGGTVPMEERPARVQLFDDAETGLNEAGYVGINPGRWDHEEPRVERGWQDYMRLSLMDIAGADGIALLPGWEKSRGARLEHDIATGMDIPVARLDQWLDMAKALNEDEEGSV